MVLLSSLLVHRRQSKINFPWANTMFCLNIDSCWKANKSIDLSIVCQRNDVSFWQQKLLLANKERKMFLKRENATWFHLYINTWNFSILKRRGTEKVFSTFVSEVESFEFYNLRCFTSFCYNKQMRVYLTTWATLTFYTNSIV